MANIMNRYSTRDGVARPRDREPVELHGYAAKYAVILTVKRLGITRPADVLNDLEIRHFRIAGQRPLEVVRSIMKREAGIQRNRKRPPTLVSLRDGRFRFREASLTTTTQKRWEKFLPTVTGEPTRSE
jgi:hypothetical protein